MPAGSTRSVAGRVHELRSTLAFRVLSADTCGNAQDIATRVGATFRAAVGERPVDVEYQVLELEDRSARDGDVEHQRGGRPRTTVAAGLFAGRVSRTGLHPFVSSDMRSGIS
jgi:hypothetical protein